MYASLALFGPGSVDGAGFRPIGGSVACCCSVLNPLKYPLVETIGHPLTEAPQLIVHRPDNALQGLKLGAELITLALGQHAELVRGRPVTPLKGHHSFQLLVADYDVEQRFLIVLGAGCIQLGQQPIEEIGGAMCSTSARALAIAISKPDDSE